MPVSADAYCGLEDLRKGDIPLPRYMGDGSAYVNTAAEEIDAALGNIFVTPIKIDEAVAAYRPSRLLLKKINWLLASGRLILDMAATGENAEQHAYGMGMLKEGLALLAQVVAGEQSLVGAVRIADSVPEGERPSSGPVIVNEDPESLVETFYRRHDGSLVARYSPSIQAAPYGQRIL